MTPATLPLTLEPLPVGRNAQTGSVHVHRFADSVRVTDTTNAGKRGKRVATFKVWRADFQSVDWAGYVAAALATAGTYQAARELGGRIIAQDPRYRLEDETLRGVDVEPPGGLELRTSAGLLVEVSPWRFAVRHRWPLRFTVGPLKGELTGHHQDTWYHSAGKRDGQAFYRWALAHLSTLDRMTVAELRALWQAEGIQYDYH